MALTLGARLGPYEIQAALGAGGMGEVYRARDTRLQRDVAIKVLSEQLLSMQTASGGSAARGQIPATLNHPNLAAIYGFEEAQDRTSLDKPVSTQIGSIDGTKRPASRKPHQLTACLRVIDS